MRDRIVRLPIAAGGSVDIKVTLRGGFLEISAPATGAVARRNAGPRGGPGALKTPPAPENVAINIESRAAIALARAVADGIPEAAVAKAVESGLTRERAVAEHRRWCRRSLVAELAASEPDAGRRAAIEALSELAVELDNVSTHRFASSVLNLMRGTEGFSELVAKWRGRSEAGQAAIAASPGLADRAP